MSTIFDTQAIARAVRQITSFLPKCWTIEGASIQRIPLNMPATFEANCRELWQRIEDLDLLVNPDNVHRDWPSHIAEAFVEWNDERRAMLAIWETHEQYLRNHATVGPSIPQHVVDELNEAADVFLEGDNPIYPGFYWLRLSTEDGVAVVLAYWNGQRWQVAETVGDREGLSVEYYQEGLIVGWSELVAPEV